MHLTEAVKLLERSAYLVEYKAAGLEIVVPSVLEDSEVFLFTVGKQVSRFKKIDNTEVSKIDDYLVFVDDTGQKHLYHPVRSVV